MWLITPIGFFSIVRKPEDEAQGTLTVRARVATDLEALRSAYLPSLGPVQESLVNDYRFRAVAPQAEVAAAAAKLIEAIDYSNFKDEVAQCQGPSRAALYHDVWAALWPLQKQAVTHHSEPSHTEPEGVWHPQRDDSGHRVEIRHPHRSSSPQTWLDPQAAAQVAAGTAWDVTVLNGVPFLPWAQVPTTSKAWAAVSGQIDLAEPPLKPPPGKRPASGVVIEEPDGRVWVVAPTNRFGGYEYTFPKGRIERGLPLQASAIKEAFEESGLQVEVTGLLGDFERTTSFTRYYRARRVGGTPAAMGWESQSVSLVPLDALPDVLAAAADQPVLKQLLRR